MKFNLSATSNATKIILICEFILVSYLLYSLTVNIYQSYQIDSHIKNFQEENAKIVAENKKKAEDLLYYTSSEYIDKIAKQNFNLINPGEEVIIIPEGENIPINDDASNDSAVKNYYYLSNPARWWKFFFEVPNMEKS